MDFDEFRKAVEGGATFRYNIDTPTQRLAYKSLYHMFGIWWGTQIRHRYLKKMYKHHTFLENETTVTEFRRKLDEED